MRDIDHDYSDLTLTITLTGRAAHDLRRRRDITGMTGEAVAEEAVSDGVRHSTYNALYRNRVEHITTLDGWAKKLADIALALGAMPRIDAAAIVAGAEDQFGANLLDNVHAVNFQRLKDMWSGVTIGWGERENGSIGPLEPAKLPVEITPDQHDALERIGHPGTISQGAARALSLGIPQLDPTPGKVFDSRRQRRMTAVVTRGDIGVFHALCVETETWGEGETEHEAFATLHERTTEHVNRQPEVLDRWPLIDPFELSIKGRPVRLAAVLDKTETGQWTGREPLTRIATGPHPTRHAAIQALQQEVKAHAELEGLPAEINILPLDIACPQEWLEKQEAERLKSLSPEIQQAAYRRFYRESEQ
ncbi:hypothetical protein ACWFRJ_39435 [Streptomyces sp. NPDC055239]